MTAIYVDFNQDKTAFFAEDTHQVILVIENMMMCIHSILDKAATRVYYPQHQVVHCLLFVNSLFGVVRMSLSNGYKGNL